MAKKSNRPKSKTATRPAAKPVVIESEPEVAPPAPAEPRAAKAPKLSRSQVAAERIEDEYSFIVGDLRRVIILAVAMFALLVILNVVLSLT